MKEINDCSCGRTAVFQLSPNISFEFNAHHGELIHDKRVKGVYPDSVDYKEMHLLCKEWLRFVESNKHWLKLD